MTTEKIKKFLWNSLVLNFFFLLLLTAVFFSADTVYQIHSQWFLAPKEDFVTYIYYIVGFYKFMWIFFNVIPYIAIRMLEDKRSKS